MDDVPVETRFNNNNTGPNAPNRMALSSISVLTDNGYEYGNKHIEQAKAWYKTARTWHDEGITSRYFLGSLSGGDSQRNPIERQWPKVYRPLTGLSLPHEKESVPKIIKLLNDAGIDSTMAEQVPAEWNFEGIDEKSILKHLHIYPYLRV